MALSAALATAGLGFVYLSLMDGLGLVVRRRDGIGEGTRLHCSHGCIWGGLIRFIYAVRVEMYTYSIIGPSMSPSC